MVRRWRRSRARRSLPRRKLDHVDCLLREGRGRGVGLTENQGIVMRSRVQRSTSRNLFFATLTLVSIITLWLRTGVPAYIIADAKYDDELFVRLARSIVAGQWLGPFDNLTLVKGVGYPAFLALAFIVGVPLKIAETLVYLSASAVCACVVARWSRSYVTAAALFCGLSLNPVLWHNELARVIREGLYVSLSLLAVVLAVVLARPARRSRPCNVALTISTAVIWAWFWLTREEGLWLVPSLVLAAGYAAHGWWRARASEGRHQATTPLLLFSFATIGAATLVGFVALANFVSYGAFNTVEVKSRPFERAYGALYRVQPARFQRLVVFPTDVRAAVYKVSPAARKLRPAFEGAIGEGWRRAGCTATPLIACNEILAGWFQWALRDAVATAGYYRNAATAAGFYTRLADEVDRACDNGQLTCLPQRASLAPPFRTDYATGALQRIPLLAEIYWSESLHVGPQNHSVAMPAQPTVGSERVVRMADFVGSAKPTETEARWSRLASERRNQAITKVIGLYSSIYAIVLVVLVMAAPFGFCLLIIRRRQPADEALIVLAAACWLAVAMRAILLLYLDVTAIPSINVLYASPASPLLVVAAIVSSYRLGNLFGLQRSA